MSLIIRLLKLHSRSALYQEAPQSSNIIYVDETLKGCHKLDLGVTILSLGSMERKTEKKWKGSSDSLISIVGKNGRNRASSFTKFLIDLIKDCNETLPTFCQPIEIQYNQLWISIFNRQLLLLSMAFKWA